MRKSTMILGSVFLVLLMLTILFLAGGTLSAKLDVMTANASEYPKAYASIQTVLQSGAPQLFFNTLPEDPVAGAPGDVAVYSITGEGSTVAGRSTGTVNLKLVSLADSEPSRTYHIQYYVYGMKRAIDIAPDAIPSE